MTEGLARPGMERGRGMAQACLCVALAWSGFVVGGCGPADPAGASPTASPVGGPRFAPDPEEAKLTIKELVRGHPARKEIALTFDDGPHAQFTPRLLEILKAEGVVATFFLVGRMVRRHPDLVVRMAADGHQLANHTFTHRDLTTLPPEEVRAELEQTSDAVFEVVGYRPRMFRPPGGRFTGETRRVAEETGMINVLWTSNPGDFHYPSAREIEDRIVAEAVPGGIVLLHSGIPETMNALPGAVRRLRAAGYTFVTCTQIASGGPPPRVR